MGLEIYVSAGIGQGSTPLSAFDNALFEAGIGNYNLVVLSSVVPIGATIHRKQWYGRDEEWGYKLYVVLAHHTALAEGQEAWAGLGWVQSEHDGRGLFVEHHGESRQHVEDSIESSLATMATYREEPLGPTQMAVVGTVSEGAPTCALVAAVYQAEGWETTR